MVAHRGSTRRPAFTLVELLVVVAVVALLVGMLMPSLRRAREQTKRTVCAVHLKSLGTSWEVYTIEYGSAPRLARRGIDVNFHCSAGDSQSLGCYRVEYPPLAPEIFDDYLHGSEDAQVWLSALHYRHVLFQVSNPPPPGPLPGHFWNWGLMWTSGVVADPRVFFCPSVKNPDFAWNTPLNPWPPRRETMWRPDSPGQVNHTDSSYQRRVGLTGVLWDRVPSQTMIAHDLAAPNVGTTAHRVGATVVYRDGHVLFMYGKQFNGWWTDTDVWPKESTRRKLLALTYWMDTEGRWPFDSADYEQ